MKKQPILHLAFLLILSFLLSACAQPTPSPGIPANVPISPSQIVISEDVEDLVIEASVKVGLCLLDESFCSLYSLEVEEHCDSAPEGERECCLAIATLHVQPEVLKPELQDRYDQLRQEFSEYERRNERRPYLPADLEWIVKLNEEILQDVFEEIYGPSFTATSNPWITCEQTASEHEIETMFQRRVHSQYGQVFRLCLTQSACFPLPIDALVPVEGVISDQPWLPPDPQIRFGVDCGWVIGPQMPQIVCPGSPLNP